MAGAEPFFNFSSLDEDVMVQDLHSVLDELLSVGGLVSCNHLLLIFYVLLKSLILQVEWLNEQHELAVLECPFKESIN